MVNFKLIYDIVAASWKVVREAGCKKDVTDEDYDLMLIKANDMTKDIEVKHGMDERILFSALFNAMADYIGKKKGAVK